MGNTLQKLSLKEHQQILYDIVYHLDDYCNQHNIQYFIAYGTLIGAVRHGGIIPWDDDIDVWMVREEYERFLKEILKYPIPGYTVNSIESTRGYYYPFIKLSKDGTLLIEPFKYVPPIGINIDIFPIDGCPSSDLEEAKSYAIKKRDEIWYQIHHWTDMRWHDYHGIAGKTAYLKYSIPYFKKKKLKQHYDSCTNYSIQDSKFFSKTVWSFDEGRDIHSIDTIADTVHLTFGTRKLPAPIGFQKILTAIYGDYMTPPSTEKQKSTHQHNGVYLIS